MGIRSHPIEKLSFDWKNKFLGVRVETVVIKIFEIFFKELRMIDKVSPPIQNNPQQVLDKTVGDITQYLRSRQIPVNIEMQNKIRDILVDGSFLSEVYFEKTVGKLVGSFQEFSPNYLKNTDGSWSDTHHGICQL